MCTAACMHGCFDSQQSYTQHGAQSASSAADPRVQKHSSSSSSSPPTQAGQESSPGCTTRKGLRAAAARCRFSSIMRCTFSTWKGVADGKSGAASAGAAHGTAGCASLASCVLDCICACCVEEAWAVAPLNTSATRAKSACSLLTLSISHPNSAHPTLFQACNYRTCCRRGSCAAASARSRSRRCCMRRLQVVHMHPRGQINHQRDQELQGSRGQCCSASVRATRGSEAGGCTAVQLPCQLPAERGAPQAAMYGCRNKRNMNRTKPTGTCSPGRNCSDSPIHQEAADADGYERNGAAKSHGYVADKRGGADAAAL